MDSSDNAPPPPLAEYLGNKTATGDAVGFKICRVMSAAFGNLEEWRLVDAFAGSGAFAVVASPLFRDAVTNDCEPFSQVMCSALFDQPANPIEWPDLDGDTLPNGFIARNFAVVPGSKHNINPAGALSRRESANGRTAVRAGMRCFFTLENARVIESFYAWAHAQEEKQKRFALGCLMHAMTRVINTGMSQDSSNYIACEKDWVGRVNKQTNRFRHARPSARRRLFIRTPPPSRRWPLPLGGWDTPPPLQIRPFAPHAMNGKVLCVCGDALEAARTHCNDKTVLYLDPPYNRRCYRHMNHITAMLAEPRWPDESTLSGLSGESSARRVPKSAWCGPEALEQLSAILRSTTAPRIVMSYGGQRQILSTESIRSTFAREGWAPVAPCVLGADGCAWVADGCVEIHRGGKKELLFLYTKEHK